jgi:hypothetical protein
MEYASKDGGGVSISSTVVLPNLAAQGWRHMLKLQRTLSRMSLIIRGKLGIYRQDKVERDLRGLNDTSIPKAAYRPCSSWGMDKDVDPFS